MDYTIMPSLEYIAVVRVATALWHREDISDFVARFPLIYYDLEEKNEMWQKIQDKVIEKVPQVGPLPQHLKLKIVDLIKPVGYQIIKWMEYNLDNSLDSVIFLPNELCWSPIGTVDKKRMAEILIRDENLRITDRYKLACIYCLEDNISELWNRMPESSKQYFYNKEEPLKVRQQELVVIWTYEVKGESAEMDNIARRRCRTMNSRYQYALDIATTAGNKAATEYFFQKLTPSDRDKVLVKVAENVAKLCSYNTELRHKYYTDVLCYLLSQMNDEQLTKVLKICPYDILTCLLDWPWRFLFSDMANRIMGFS